MKKCKVGKSCGGSCISQGMTCRVALRNTLTGGLSKLSNKLQIEWDVKSEPSGGEWGDFWAALGTKAPSNMSDGTENARSDAREFDEYFTPTKKVGPGYDWTKSYEKGSKLLGEGSYGTVIASKEPPPVVVKRGEITENEIKVLNKLNGKGISPQIISAEMGNKIPGAKEFEEKGLREGRIAMERVSGKESSSSDDYDTPVGKTTVGDAFWSLRRRLHMEGISHNDSHRGNVIFDESGKARYVDFGMAQDNSKAALSEAIGFLARRRFLPFGSVTKNPLGTRTGDWQSSRFEQFTGNDFRNVPPKSNLQIVINNRLKVFSKLRDLGLDDNEIADVVTTGIRNDEKTYEKGPWGKISKGDARDLIAILYEGVE